MKKIQEMTLKEKIGQLVFAGFQGTEISPELATLIDEYHLGNIILFARNIENIRQLWTLNRSLYQRITEKSGIIPFISIDQEGGMVTRIMKEATFCPGNMTIGATVRENAYRIGKVSGTELRALGINMNLAPSLDVNNNPLNPVIGVRSYSDNPEEVSRFGLEYIRGLQETGIIATAKHFPGHGDTSSDSHFSLPVVPHNKKRLETVELYPFKKAIASGVDAIMSAHVFFTAYEEVNLPATLSKKVLTDLLREELGFTGLIVSDCMEMKAIDDFYTAPKGALMGLLAGLDMVFVSQTYEKQRDALRLIEEAVLDGRFPMEALDEKVERILRYKEKVLPAMEEYFLKTTFETVESLVTAPESKILAQEITDNSLSRVRGKDFYPNKPTLVIATEPFATTIAEDKLSDRSIIDALKMEKVRADTVKIKVNPDDSEIEGLVEKAKSYPQVVICTYNAGANRNQAKLVNRLYFAVEDLFVISTRNPYDLLQFRQIKNYLCVYEYTPNSVKTITKYLKRDLVPTGRLPVRIEESIRIGASVYVGLKEYPLAANLRYLELLKEKHISLVFISAHIPEMNEDFEKELAAVIDKADSLGLKTILDVSRPMMERFRIPHVYSLRLDYGFSNEDIEAFYRMNRFFIELNASVVTREQLEYFVGCGLDLSRFRVSHNFYPKPFTGLSREEIEKRNRMFHEFGMKVMMYIPSSTGKRPPIYQGLPTAEAHRNMGLEAILSEMKYLGADEVVFGDSFASADELERAAEFDFSIVQIPISTVKDLSETERRQIEAVHQNRIDQPESMIRSSLRLHEGIIGPHHNETRHFGDVTVDNHHFLRYQGEVSIVLEDLPADSRVNVIGKVMASEYLLQHIKPGDKFKLIITGEK